MISKGFFVGIVFLSIGSMVTNSDYVNNIANAVALPVFILSILDLITRLRNNTIVKIEQKKNIATTEKEWVKWVCERVSEPLTYDAHRCFLDHKMLIENIDLFNNEIIKIRRWFSWCVPIYIVSFGITAFLAIMANFEFVKKISSCIDSTVLTLWTLSIFMFDAVFGESLSEKLIIKAEQSLKENNPKATV